MQEISWSRLQGSSYIATTSQRRGRGRGLSLAIFIYLSGMDSPSSVAKTSAAGT